MTSTTPPPSSPAVDDPTTDARSSHSETHNRGIERLRTYLLRGWHLVLRFPAAVLIAVIGIVWTKTLYSYGLDLSPDSIFYLKTASIMHHNGDYNTLVTVWPPLYPLVIRVFMLFTPYPATAAALASGALLTGTLTCIFAMLRAIIKRPLLELLLILWLLSLPFFWDVFHFAWSESAFAFFAATHFLAMLRYTITRRTVWLFVAMGAASAAALSRYVGYSLLIPMGVMTILAIVDHASIKGRLTIATAYLLSLIPSALWAFRNRGIDGTWHGVRADTRRTALESLHHLVRFLDNSINEYLLLLLAGVIGFFVFRLYASCSRHRKAPPFQQFETYVVGVSLIYSAMLVYATSRANINAIGARMCHPLAIVSVLLIATGIHHIDEWVPRYRINRILVGGATLLLLMGTALNVKPLTGKFSSLSRIDKTQSDYLSLGFERSDNAQKIGQYLRRIVDTEDTVLFSGLWNSNPPRPYLAHGMFLRRFIWNDNAIQGLRFEYRIPPTTSSSIDYLNQECDFQVAFKWKTTDKHLHYRGLFPVRTKKDIIDHMVHHMDELNLDHGYLVEYRHPKKSPLVKLSSLSAAPEGSRKLRITQPLRLPNFVIHRLSRHSQ